jgi:putative tryptophan/tyrosine transport system substrate-binding protein
MRRRDLIALLGGALALPLPAHPQPERRRSIAILMPYPEDDSAVRARVAAFRDELRALGWSEGDNLRVLERWATDDLDRVRASAAELVELGPEVIVFTGGRVVPILQQQTRSIPTVFVGISDPLGRGVVASLARPGENITGVALSEYSIVTKLLEILKQLAPNLMRAGLVFNPENPSSVYFQRHFETAAQALAIEPAILPVRDATEFERAIETFARRPRGGLVFPSDLTLLAHRDAVAALASRYRLPAVYSDRVIAAAGGLASYSADRTEMFRRAASYVDRILRGEAPGNLPVEQPTRYELVINLKTAAALGVEVPPLVLAGADEVIE